MGYPGQILKQPLFQKSNYGPKYMSTSIQSKHTPEKKNPKKKEEKEKKKISTSLDLLQIFKQLYVLRHLLPLSRATFHQII